MQERQVPPGLTAERIGFFTDAVFAIAMTLLVIEIPRPEAEDFAPGEGVSPGRAAANLWDFLVGQATSFYAYFIAFFMLWIVWRQHHVLIDRIHRVSPGIVSWHFPLLLLVGFTPYVTTILGHYDDNPLAALLYAVTVALLLFCRSIIQSLAYRGDLLHAHLDRDTVRRSTVVSWVMTGYWFAALVPVWWFPTRMQIVWFLSPVVAAVIGRLIAPHRADRHPATARTPAQTSSEAASSDLVQPSQTGAES